MTLIACLASAVAIVFLVLLAYLAADDQLPAPVRREPTIAELE